MVVVWGMGEWRIVLDKERRVRGEGKKAASGWLASCSHPEHRGFGQARAMPVGAVMGKG